MLGQVARAALSKTFAARHLEHGRASIAVVYSRPWEDCPMAPVGFPQLIETWIDEDLLRYEVVWAAAGAPNAVFSTSPVAIATITAGTVTRVR